jgi:hypothetical protein
MLMSALGQKRTSEYVCIMSALPPKVDIEHITHLDRNRDYGGQI